MGFLKEALKCICVENQWSYAVFWKIGCRNPTLLVWEECHYEPARYSSLKGISGLESTEALLKEWEGLGSSETQLSRLGCQVEDRVCSLIKMMMNNQVHVFGQGMVGRAAFTGSHLWILQENCRGEGHPPEVMTEVNHQFSAGMQAVAVIPVLPHGVVQLASTLAIKENICIVNNVKNLFAKLGRVPGALLSHNYLNKDPCEKIGLPLSAEETNSKMETFSPLAGYSCNQQILPSQVSGFARQSSHSLTTQIQDNMPVNVLALQTTPRVTPSISKSPNDLFQENSHLMMKSNLPLRSQQEAASMGSEVFPSSAGGHFNSRGSQYDPGSGFSRQSIVGQSNVSFSGGKFIEQQILSGDRLLGPVNSSIPASSSTATEVRASKVGVSNYLKDSIIASLLGGSKLPNAGTGLQALTSFPCSRSMQCRSDDSNPHFPPQEGGGPHSNLSNTKVVSLSNHAAQSNTSDMLPGSSHQCHSSTNEKHTQTEFSAREHGVEDLFQALNIPPGQDGHISRSGTMSATIQDSSMTSQELERGTMALQHVPEDARVRHSSGEDLFDILGLDFKSKLLCGTGSDFLMHGTGATVHSLGTDASMCLTQMDAGRDFYAINDGISESGIFSEAGIDHLLDAVVSKAHSTSKQNSDDDMSCNTTVTRISSSSVISDAPTYGSASVSDQMKVDMFGLPPPLSKVEMARSSSFKSGCSVDNVGGSQINPIYRSQISLWMEDGHNLKQENSTTTANSKKPDETSKTNRKRLRPGESPRPRPKDRQMIQDRVKELREIVPNGAKCSIDALLERTIKHMLFLQSVTKHADKLKQSGESKFINKEGGLLLKDNFEGGATWAYEVGSQSMIYPIVVEDLNTPRQMLVEMLCEERGFFLEIADIIRGLGLTILKGIMEARNDKVWAHFAVEANRDVTRMEIFLSLVHLLEKAGMGNSRTLKGIDGSNLMVHNNCNQASIPATGPCNSLQ